MNNYKITLQKSEKDHTNQLVYSGELSFNHIQSIIKETESMIKTTPAISAISIEEVDLLDLSFIQMIISLKKTYQLKVNLNLAEELTELIQVSGVYKYLIDEN